MTASLEIEFLGTGTSTGVPVIGCPCSVCQSEDARNKRLRSSIVVRYKGTTLLIDSSPDLRQQALRSGLTRIDAILYSHIHLDHVAGFDDLRAFCWHTEGKLPLYAGKETMEGLKTMFGWAFHEANTYQGYVRPDPRIIEGPTRIGSLLVTPIHVQHGSVEANGYLFETEEGKKLVYIPDVKQIPDSSLALITGVDLLVMDALRFESHPTHSSVEETLDVFHRAKVKRGCFTHMSHHIDYEEMSMHLPENVFLAYDGLTVQL